MIPIQCREDCAHCMVDNSVHTDHWVYRCDFDDKIITRGHDCRYEAIRDCIGCKYYYPRMDHTSRCHNSASRFFNTDCDLRGRSRGCGVKTPINVRWSDCFRRLEISTTELIYSNNNHIECILKGDFLRTFQLYDCGDGEILEVECEIEHDGSTQEYLYFVANEILIYDAALMGLFFGASGDGKEYEPHFEEQSGTPQRWKIVYTEKDEEEDE